MLVTLSRIHNLIRSAEQLSSFTSATNKIATDDEVPNL